MTIPSVYVRRLRDVLETDNESFTALAKLGGLDPATSFRGADLRRVDFGSADLTGFDFRNANLVGAIFANARGLDLSMFEGASCDITTRWPEHLRDIMTKRLVSTSQSLELPPSAAMFDTKVSIKPDDGARENTEEQSWNGDVYWSLHNNYQYTEALEYCRSVRKRDPKNVSARTFEAHMLERHFHQADAAIALLMDAMRNEPTEVNFHYFLAQALKTKGEFTGAETEYRTTISMTDGVNRARAQIDLASLLIEQISNENKVISIEIQSLLIQACDVARQNNKSELEKTGAQALTRWRKRRALLEPEPVSLIRDAGGKSDSVATQPFRTLLGRLRNGWRDIARLLGVFGSD